MERLWTEWIEKGRLVDLAVDFALSHPIYQLLHVNTFQIAAVLFAITVFMALLNFAAVNIPSERREREKAEGENRDDFSERDLRRNWRDKGLLAARNRKREKRGKSPLSPDTRLQWGEVLLRFPEHVAGGFERIIDLLQKALYWSNVLIVAVAAASPFILDDIVRRIYALYPNLPPPSGSFQAEIEAFQAQLSADFVGYLACAAVWAAAAFVLVWESRRARRRTVMLGAVAVLAAASVPLAFFFQQMLGHYIAFFNPASEANAGYSIFYISTSGDMAQNVQAQLWLSPIYALPIAAALVPVIAAALVAITILFKTRSAQSRWRRVFRTVAAPLAPGLVLSFCVTIVAAGLGDQFAGGQSMRPAPAFLVLNAAGDALTILSTFVVLWLVKLMIRRAEGTSFFKIFTSVPLMAATLGLIVIDLLIAGIVAVFVVHWGAGTSGQVVSLQEASLILFGLSESGAQRFEFDSLFWVMHTTFIPTLAFFSVLGMSILVMPMMIIKVVYAKILGVYEWISRILEIFLIFTLPGVSVQIMWWLATQVFGEVTLDDYYDFVQNVIAALRPVYAFFS